MPARQNRPFPVRLLCSILATAICWAIAGIVLCVIIAGPGTLAAWLMWGTGVCFIGWVPVGIPLVAAGDRICRLPPVALALGVGSCGVLLMGLPYLTAVLTRDFG